MSKKKIILSLGAIVLVAIIAVGATGAYFSDTETSVGNKFVAGKFNLQIDNTCEYNGKACTDNKWNGTDEPCSCTWSMKDLDNELFFDFPDVKPGDNGEDTVKLHVDNNDAWMCATITNLQNDDNGCDSPENKVDTTCGDGEGELASNLFFTIWKDTNCDNILALDIPEKPAVPAYCGGGIHSLAIEECASAQEDQEDCQTMIGWGYGCVWIPYEPAEAAQTGEQILVNNQLAMAGYWPLADATTGSGPIIGDQTQCFGVKWNVPLATSNIIQTDSLTGDVAFNAVQARNMDSFKCSDIYTEVCDGVDNDLDGVIDDGGVCWVSPTSNNDAGWWTNDAGGRDGNWDTTARTEWIPLGVWTDTLTYYVSPAVPSAKLKFSSTGNWGSGIEIKVTVDGVSQLVYSGANSQPWMELPLSPAGLVSQIDIRGTNLLDSNFSVLTILHEIQILRTP